MKKLHFEVGHELKTLALPDGEINGDAGPVKKVRSKVFWQSHELSPERHWTDPRILAQKACQYAHCSEKFFLMNVNAESSWLRTVIDHAQIEGNMTYWTKAGRNEFDSDIIMHSNIIPYNPHWSKLWERSGIETGNYQSEEGVPTSRKEMKATDGNDRPKKELAKGVWQITLNGGQFVGKTGEASIIQRELCILNQIKAHPHIVYFFNHVCAEAQDLCKPEPTDCADCTAARKASGDKKRLCQRCEKSEISVYFMEYMAYDLQSIILERTRIDKMPLFKLKDAVDILLQIANAMKHIHEEGVVHCDLKPANILTCEIPTGDEGGKKFLVKVADFGSAKQAICTSPIIAGPRTTSSFTAGPGTTAYTSPEALMQQPGKHRNNRSEIAYPMVDPRAIDVYSFGIVAFEVLTGDIAHVNAAHRSPILFKIGVLEGERPPIRKFAEVIDKGLISEGLTSEGLIPLVEKCWHEEPAERPNFAKVCEELNKVGRRCGMTLHSSRV